MSSVAAEKMEEIPQPTYVMKVRILLFFGSMYGETP